MKTSDIENLSNEIIDFLDEVQSPALAKDNAKKLESLAKRLSMKIKQGDGFAAKNILASMIGQISWLLGDLGGSAATGHVTSKLDAVMSDIGKLKIF